MEDIIQNLTFEFNRDSAKVGETRASMVGLTDLIMLLQTEMKDDNNSVFSGRYYWQLHDHLEERGQARVYSLTKL